MRKAYLYVDGASRGNPGLAGIGFILIDEQGAVLTRCGEPIGVATNNEAEYRALLRGLEEAIGRGIEHLVCYTDSELLARQLQGVYAVRSSKLKPLFEQVHHRIKLFRRFEIHHLPREQNRIADRLAQLKIARRTFGMVKFPVEQPSTGEGGMSVHLFIVPTEKCPSFSRAEDTFFIAEVIMGLDITYEREQKARDEITQSLAKSNSPDEIDRLLMKDEMVRQEALSPLFVRDERYGYRTRPIIAHILVGATDWSGRFVCTYKDLTEDGKILYDTLQKIYPDCQLILATILYT